jgi:hypothetical protein
MAKLRRARGDGRAGQLDHGAVTGRNLLDAVEKQNDVVLTAEGRGANFQRFLPLSTVLGLSRVRCPQQTARSLLLLLEDPARYRDDPLSCQQVGLLVEAG